LSILNPYEPEYIEIGVDKEGIIPVILEEKLTKRKEEKKTMPKLLYSIPHCSNPTGF
jgi:DNA-binding transcriptional MocR family regulator